MFAITFDLVVADVKRFHPKAVNRAYEQVRHTLARNGFVWEQGSVYINPDGGLVALFSAMNNLKALPRFPQSVREIRAFRLENNSDFAALMKS
ncbi:MAG TPA: virulence factor [Acidobacteriaceae bacterium]